MTNRPAHKAMLDSKWILGRGVDDDQLVVTGDRLQALGQGEMDAVGVLFGGHLR